MTLWEALGWLTLFAIVCIMVVYLISAVIHYILAIIERKKYALKAQNQILGILDKIEFIHGQRAGRELWSIKDKDLQEKDLESFRNDIDAIRRYVMKH